MEQEQAEQEQAEQEQVEQEQVEQEQEEQEQAWPAVQMMGLQRMWGMGQRELLEWTEVGG